MAAKVDASFDRFEDNVAYDLYDRCTFIGLFPTKKASDDEKLFQNAISSSGEFASRTDAKIFLRRLSDDDERRQFMLQTREGVNIPWTYLDYNALTRTSQLGQSVKDERRQQAQSKKVATREAIRSDILDFLLKHPGATQADIMENVSGRTDTKFEVLKEGEYKHWSKSDGGVRGQPFTYCVKELETEIVL